MPAFSVDINVTVAFVLGIFSLLTGIYFWIRFHVHFPVQDLMHFMPFVQTVLENGFSSQSMADWLASHAGAHRIAVMRLAMVVDYRYFGGQNHVMYALTLLGVVLLLLVFLTVFRQNYKTESALCVFVIGISLIFLCSNTQAVVLIHPLNSSWYLALGSSAASILLVTRRATPPNALHFVAAYLFAAVGAYSNFSGVIVWLLLPVLIGFRSARIGLLAALISGAFVALYLHGMGAALDASQPAPNAVDANLIATQQSVAAKTLVVAAGFLIRGAFIIVGTFNYLGAPLSITYPIWAALLLVMPSLVVIIVAWRELLMYWFLGRGRHNSWLETTTAIATVTLGIAIATQLGRSWFPPTAPRYQTVVMLYWLSICCLVLYFGLKAQGAQTARKFFSTTLCLGIAAALLLVPSRSMTGPVKLSEKANQVSWLGLLGVSGDAIDYGGVSPRRPPDFMFGLNAYFMKTHSAYWHNASRHISFDGGVECDQIDLAMAPSQWPGVFTVTVHIQDQWPKLYRQIPVTTGQGEVIGFLSPVMVGEVTPLSIYSKDENTWTGYIRGGEGLTEAVYLHYRTGPRSGVACRLQI